MMDFRLSCCRMLEQYPLYRYRVPSENGRSTLPVLLLGGGAHMEAILHEILCNGQLLDTDLKVSIVDEHAADTAETLLKSAPELSRFVRISRDSQAGPRPEEALWAELSFETAPLTAESAAEILLEQCECRYIVISTEDDAHNEALADACAQIAADPGTLIAYVQLQDGEDILKADTHHFGAKQEDSYRAGLEQTAFNLHYAYAKAQNERQSMDEILREFRVPYHYISNMRAAVHIHGKLSCCGINAADPIRAASQFARLMEEQPEIVERLAASEHRRWVMDKLLQGYRQVEDLNLLYSGPDMTTHDSTGRWHCCLVPCDETGKSRLTEADWKAKAPRAGLDPLDRISFQIHEKCGHLAQANRQEAELLIQGIKSASAALSPQAGEAAHRMELAVCHLWQQKRSAIPLYQREWRLLHDAAEGPKAALLVKSLERLDAVLAPLSEFISYKDYKDANRLLIRQIPFALTHKRSPVLIKLMAEQETLFSPWQLEPEKLILLGSASNLMELTQLRTKADTATRFLQNSTMALDPIYHVFVPDHMGVVKQQKKALFKGWNCTIHPVGRWELGTLSDAVAASMEPFHGDFVDVTGGDPLLTRAVEAYAERAGIPTFYIHDGQMRNLTGAEALTYPAPSKGITVREMFDLSGAVLEECDSEKLTDLSGQYRALWNIAHGASCWVPFCHTAAQSYRNTGKEGSRAGLSVQDMPLGEGSVYLPTLKKLEANNFIQDLMVTRQGACCSFRFASKEILSCIQSSGSILEHYIYYSALLDGHFDDVEMGWQFLHSAGEASARNEIDVICTKRMTSLFISAKMLTRSNLRANNHLNYILYEISLLADRFGIHAKPVLVAPAIEQFQNDPQTGRQEISSVVQLALRRGVYLLGDACFQEGAMGQILDRIADGNEDWCLFLLNGSVQKAL